MSPVVRLSAALDAVEPEPDAELTVRVTAVDGIRVDLRFLPATAVGKALELLFVLVALDFCLIDA